MCICVDDFRVRFLDKQKKQKAGKEIASTNTDQAGLEGDNNQDQSLGIYSTFDNVPS